LKTIKKEKKMEKLKSDFYLSPALLKLPLKLQDEEMFIEILNNLARCRFNDRNFIEKSVSLNGPLLKANTFS
jgi:hypothetical protein